MIKTGREEDGKLIREEKVMIGHVNRTVYARFIRDFRVGLILLALSLMIMNMCIQVRNNWIHKENEQFSLVVRSATRWANLSTIYTLVQFYVHGKVPLFLCTSRSYTTDNVRHNSTDDISDLADHVDEHKPRGLPGQRHSEPHPT